MSRCPARICYNFYVKLVCRIKDTTDRGVFLHKEYVTDNNSVTKETDRDNTLHLSSRTMPSNPVTGSYLHSAQCFLHVKYML